MRGWDKSVRRNKKKTETNLCLFFSWIDTEERTIKRTVSLFREMVGNLIGRAATLPRARVCVCTEVHGSLHNHRSNRDESWNGGGLRSGRRWVRAEEGPYSLFLLAIMPFRHQRTLILSRKERSPPLNQAFTINRFHLPFDFTDFQGEGGALRHLFQLFFLLGSPGSLLWMVFTGEKVSNLPTKSLNHFFFCSLNSSYWIPELEIPACFVCVQLLSLLSSWINDVAYVISKRRGAQ